MENISIQDLETANKIIRTMIAEHDAEGFPAPAITWTGRIEIIEGQRRFEIDASTVTGWSSGKIQDGFIDFIEI